MRKGYRYNISADKGWRALLATLSVLVACAAFKSSAADNRQASSAEGQERQIRIKADQLVADLKASQAEFSGNVQVTYGDTVITADRLIIYQHQNLKTEDETIIDRKSIEKVVAQGHVRIELGDAVASAETAEFQPESDELTLSGRNATVVSGRNSITGAKLIFYRAKGRFEATGAGRDQVKAVFSSNAKVFELSR